MKKFATRWVHFRAFVALLAAIMVACCTPGAANGDREQSNVSSDILNPGEDVAGGNTILTNQFNRALYVVRELSDRARGHLGQERIDIGYRRDNTLATYNVSNAAELNVALKAVSAGDKILLGAGDYGAVSLKNLTFDANITISSKDPSAQAVITKLDVTGSKGITFTDLEFSTNGSPKLGGLFSVVGSSKITFDNVYVHGSLNGNPQDDVDGIQLVESKDITITNSEFEQLRIAISHRDGDGMNISGNHIHDIRMDGIRGSGSSDVLISENYITDFYRVDGDHADAIQFFTGSTTQAAKNITITNNIIDRGDGLKMQGVFIRDENLKLPYENVTITGNVMIGTNANGIAVINAKNIKISDNTIVSPPDDESWIRVTDAEAVVVTNNYVRDNNSSQYLFGDIKGLTETGNKAGGAVTDGGASTLQAWLKAHPEVQLHFNEVLGGAPSTVQPPAVQPPVNLPPEANAGDPGAGGSGGEAAKGMFLHASGGNENLVGGAGVDTLSFSEMKAGVRVNLDVETKQNMVGGGKGAVTNVENLEGSQWNDTLNGNSGNNVLRGGAGDDRLDGGLGADTLVGGAGADSFHISSVANSTVSLDGRDVILDFNRAEGDRIIVRDIDAKQGGVDDPFTFVAKFTGVAGQLISVTENDHYVVMGDTNGDGQADFAVTVFSTNPLIRGDFLL